MTLEITQLILIIVPALLLEGFFAGSEIALFSADKLHLDQQAKEGSQGARIALRMVNHPERILSVTLLLTSLAVVGISALVAIYLLQQNPNHSELVAIAITSPLIVIFGELLPKTIYQRHANKIASWVSIPIYWTYYLFYPVTRLLSFYTARVSRVLGPIETLMTGKRRTTRDDVVALVKSARRDTDIKTSERQMIQRVFDFRERNARNAALPLVEVDAVEMNATIKSSLEQFQRHGHSRFPVYLDRIDNIVGILDFADLFQAEDLDQSIRRYVKPCLYAAETQRLEDILAEMHQESQVMAVIVDEHGGAVGILTDEDIVEEVVGEITDEFDPKSSPYRVISPGEWIVQAKMEIQQINESLGLQLPDGDYETLSGFLLAQFGRIPSLGDELFFNTDSGGFRFSIRQATDRHIETVYIKKM